MERTESVVMQVAPSFENIRIKEMETFGNEMLTIKTLPTSSIVAILRKQIADSEGQEGLFYVWTPEEIEAVLQPDDAALFMRLYDVSPGGNFQQTIGDLLPTLG